MMVFPELGKHSPIFTHLLGEAQLVGGNGVAVGAAGGLQHTSPPTPHALITVLPELGKH